MKKFFITLGLILILASSSLAFDMPWDLGTKYCKLIQKTTAPTSSDVSYQIGTVWLDTTNDVLYQLTDITSGVATWSYKVSNFSTKATPGTELITWTDAGWNEDGATWTFAASTLTHVTGNVTAVTGTVTGALAVGTTYQVIITGTGGTATATYTLGGCTGTTIAASGAIAIEDYLTATVDSELVITPSNTCTVALTLVSVKALTDATGDLTVQGDLFVGSKIKSIGGSGGITILPNGNVGIGTTNPSMTLQVKQVSDADTTLSVFSIFNCAGTKGLSLYANLPSGIPAFVSDYLTGSESKLHIGTYSGRDTAAGITIDTSGKVGIGTTAPDAPLEANSATGLGIRVTYNDSNGSAANHGDLTVGATGNVTLAATGTNPDIILTPAGTGQVKNTAANITVGSGTGITVNSTGSLNRQVYTVTTVFGAYTDIDTTKGIVIATLPAKTKLVGCYADTTTKYLGGAVNAATLEVGITAEGAAEILAPLDVFTAAVLQGDADAEMGTSMTRAAAIQGGYLPSWTGTTAIYATIDTTAGNLNALTQGVTVFYLVTERY